MAGPNPPHKISWFVAKIPVVAEGISYSTLTVPFYIHSLNFLSGLPLVLWFTLKTLKWAPALLAHSLPQLLMSFWPGSALLKLLLSLYFSKTPLSLNYSLSYIYYWGTRSTIRILHHQNIISTSTTKILYQQLKCL